MPRLILLDEVHVRLLIPLGLTDAESQAIWAAVVDPLFDNRVRRTVRRLIRRRPVLAKVVRVHVYR